MINPSISTYKALARLSANPDFREVFKWFEEQKDMAMRELLGSSNPVVIHQAQGEARTLDFILRLPVAATQALARQSA